MGEGISAPCGLNSREVLLFDMRLRKLEVPIFKGEVDENVDGWLHRVERYFVVNRLTGWDQLNVAILYLEREVLDWYQWQDDRVKIESWVDFK